MGLPRRLRLIALGLLAVIFHQRSFRPAPAPTPPARFVTARGATGVGESMTMRFDRPGHPVWFRTRLHARCTNPAYPGRHWTWSWGWWPADGDPTPFRRDGRALRVFLVDTRTFDDGMFGQVVLSMGARAAPEGTAARGWVRMSATFFYAVGTTTCDSGRVPFAVGATSARPS